MLYRTLADAVMVAHFGFLVFLALGGFLAWRIRWVLGAHVAAAGWAVLILAGADCPLTAAEDALRRAAGDRGLPDGFIGHYLTGVVYPQAFLRPAQVAVGVLVAASWLGLAVRLRRGHPRRERPTSAARGRCRCAPRPAARRP